MEIKRKHFLPFLKKTWNEIHGQDDRRYPYSSYTMHWWHFVFQPIMLIFKNQLFVYYEIKNNGNVMIAPLKTRMLFQNEMLSKRYSSLSFDENEFIFDRTLNDQSLKELVSIFVAEFEKHEVVICGLREDSKVLPILKEEGFAITTNPCISIHIGNDYGEYFYNLSKHARQNIRTAYNRMKTDGVKYRFQVCCCEKADKKLFNAGTDLYIQRQENRYIHNHSMLRKLFWKYFDSKTAVLRNWKENFMTAIFIDDNMAACMFGILSDCGRRALIERLTIDSEFEHYSPGVVLINETAKYLASHDTIEELDFLRGTEKYKTDMGGTYYYTYNASN